MSQVINSRALTSEKPCITKAIHVSICSYRGHRIAAVTRCILPCPRTSIVSGNRVRATSGKRRNKIVQEITRNVANVFSNSDRTWYFNALTFARSLGRCWKQRPSASVFNTSHGTRQMVMHEKPCLIPIINGRSNFWTSMIWRQGVTIFRAHNYGMFCTYELQREKTYLLTYVPNEDSNKPMNLCGLISLQCPHENTCIFCLSKMKILIRLRECAGLRCIWIFAGSTCTKVRFLR